jgi:hypothetical protein
VSFDHLFGPNDDAMYKLSRQVLDGKHRWLEAGIVGLLPDESGDGRATAGTAPGAQTLRREEAGVG